MKPSKIKLAILAFQICQKGCSSVMIRMAIELQVFACELTELHHMVPLV